MILALAFVGGLILNIMPCVLPVLTMKVFHLIQHADAKASEHRKHGLAYGAGVVTMFVVLASLLLALRAGGELVGWGMQFSNPAFVATMVALIFLFGLNSLGVFEIRIGMQDGESDGLWGSYVNGVVASIMSTPCSAPFLGSAAGFALSSAAGWQTMIIFIFIGFGLASPFVLFSFVPAMGRLLPRPGAWMETFKQLMGFTLLATSVWLYGVLMKQVSVESALWFLGFLLVLAIAVWALERFGGLMASVRARRITRTVVLLGVGLSFWQMVDLTPQAYSRAAVLGDAPVVDNRIAWRPWDSAQLLSTVQSGRPVFVDFTADWCVNCKANERLFIETERIREVLTETNILPMKADLTVENNEIRQWLEPFPYSGIPVYAIYLPDQTYDLLPQVITTELLAERLLAAAERFPATASR